MTDPIPGGAPPDDTKRSKRPLRFALRCVRDLVIAAALLHLVTAFFLQPVRVEGDSMQPGIHDAERIFINKFSYRFGSVRRGDVVVFTAPSDPGKTCIKRVVGLPGETIRISGGSVYIDGERLEEPYVVPATRSEGDIDGFTIPGGNYFVLGDHRDFSNDSRNWGPIPGDLILGRAVLRYWPPSAFGLIGGTADRRSH